MEKLELIWVKPGDAQPNPKNWRRHPEEQLAALDELIFGNAGVGWAGVALINDRQMEDGWGEEEAHLTYVDGHAREVLATEHDAEIPALLGRWDPRQEALILATLDPLVGLIDADKAALLRLLDKAPSDSVAVLNVLEKAATEAGLYKEFMQGTGSPSMGATEQLLAEEFGDVYEEDDLVDHGGGPGDFSGVFRASWPGWRLFLSEEEKDRLVKLIEDYALEYGSTNYFVSRVLLNGRTEFPGEGDDNPVLDEILEVLD
jgi:hypothetical protein